MYDKIRKIASMEQELISESSKIKLLDSIEKRLEILELDLRGLTVATEAATGFYACTATIAALAGAEVFAVGRDTDRYGSFENAREATLALAARAGVADRISVAREFGTGTLESCDIVTNSGAVRPIDREMISRLRSGAVIGLMFEAWEFRSTDLDLDACRSADVKVAAVNERHPDVAVFDFLGPLCVRLLEKGEVSLDGKRVAVLCDNPFAPYLERGLAEKGASVVVVADPLQLRTSDWHAVVLAQNPNSTPSLTGCQLAHIARAAPSAHIAQFWGDLDRRKAVELGLNSILPHIEPSPGHMGILLNELGPEPIVRLQTGGLRAAELLFKGTHMQWNDICVPL